MRLPPVHLSLEFEIQPWLDRGKALAAQVVHSKSGEARQVDRVLHGIHDQLPALSPPGSKALTKRLYRHGVHYRKLEPQDIDWLLDHASDPALRSDPTAVLRIHDGVTKMRDMPREMGGSGAELPD